MIETAISKRILQKDKFVIQDTRKYGQQIVGSLLPLTRHEDPEVREIALYCLSEVGGPQAVLAFIQALCDSEEDVQNRACLFLHRHATAEQAPILLKELNKHPNEYVRGELSLIVAETGYTDALPVLREQLRKEKDELIQKKCRLALARLKDPVYQKDILDGLISPDLDIRIEALKDFEYMNDKTLITKLLLLLDDQRPAINVAPAGHRHFIRVCDETVRVIDVVLIHPFKFKVEYGKSYSSQEIAEAKMLLSKM